MRSGFVDTVRLSRVTAISRSNTINATSQVSRQTENKLCENLRIVDSTVRLRMRVFTGVLISIHASVNLHHASNGPDRSIGLFTVARERPINDGRVL